MTLIKTEKTNCQFVAILVLFSASFAGAILFFNQKLLAESVISHDAFQIFRPAPVFASTTEILPPAPKPAQKTAVKVVSPKPTTTNKIVEVEPVFVGPRDNAPSGTPTAYGFWSFAVLESGKISRSGQPLLSEFKWLKENGWKAIVDLRADGEYNEISDDQKIVGFDELDFNYIYLPIRDGAAPTVEQARSFLDFVKDPANQPVHVHCRGGFGRAGTLIALYRYEVDGWKMEDAIAESRLFRGGIDSTQKNWLLNWEKNNKK